MPSVSTSGGNRIEHDEERVLARRARRTGVRGRGVPHEDLVHEGHLGLFEEARRFDPAYGVRFLTFAAWWIRKAMRAAIERDGAPVRVPSTQRRRMRAKLPIPRAVRLDHPVGSDPDAPTFAERLPDPTATSPERNVLRDEAIAHVRAASARSTAANARLSSCATGPRPSRR